MGHPSRKRTILSNLRQSQAQAEKCVALRFNWAGETAARTCIGWLLGRGCVRASITPLPALERLCRSRTSAVIRCSFHAWIEK